MEGSRGGFLIQCQHDPHSHKRQLYSYQPQCVQGICLGSLNAFPQTVCLNGFKMTLVAFEELKWIGACHSSRGKPTGSHGTQPRAANSVSSIHPTLPNAHWRKATLLQPTSQSLCASSSLACLHTCCHTVSCALHTSLVCTSFGGIYSMYWVIS